MGEDGKYEEFKISKYANDKYKKLTSATLSTLIRHKDYRRLSPEGKLRAMQSIINYYYNFMKDEIYKKEKSKNTKGMSREKSC